MSEDLPEGWEIAQLGELGKWTSGGTPSRSNPSFFDGEIPWLKTGDLNDSLIDHISETISELGVEKSSAKWVPSGSLVMAMYGATIGKLGILNQEATTNQACGVLRADGLTTELIPYLFQVLMSFRRQIIELGQGGAQPNISQEIIKEFEIPLAPLPEQRRIVAKLDALQKRTRIAREALEAVASLLKSFRQSVLQAAVTGTLTEEWRGQQPNAKPWTESKASEVCAKVQSGGTPKEGFISAPGVPFLKVYNIVNQKVQFEPRAQYITDSIHRGSMSKSIALPGDVLMNIVGPPLGKVAIVTDEYPEWNINQAITLFRPSQKITSGWLYAVLCSGINIQEIVNETKGSAGQVNISLSQCRDFIFPIPPIDEQTEIVRRVQHLFAMADAMEAEFGAAQRSVDQLDQSLLGTAFRGELVPQDPADEPASVLLERIRAARAELPSTKAKRGRKPMTEFDTSVLMAAEPLAPRKRGRPRKERA